MLMKSTLGGADDHAKKKCEQIRVSKKSKQFFFFIFHGRDTITRRVLYEWSLKNTTKKSCFFQTILKKKTLSLSLGFQRVNTEKFEFRDKFSRFRFISIGNNLACKTRANLYFSHG